MALESRIPWSGLVGVMTAAIVVLAGPLWDPLPSASLPTPAAVVVVDEAALPPSRPKTPHQVWRSAIVDPLQLASVPVVLAEQFDALPMAGHTLVVRTPVARLPDARTGALLTWATHHGQLQWRLSRGTLLGLALLLTSLLGSSGGWVRSTGLLMLVALGGFASLGQVWMSPLVIIAILLGWVTADLSGLVRLAWWAESRFEGRRALVPAAVPHRAEWVSTVQPVQRSVAPAAFRVLPSPTRTATPAPVSRVVLPARAVVTVARAPVESPPLGSVRLVLAGLLAAVVLLLAPLTDFVPASALPTPAAMVILDETAAVLPEVTPPHELWRSVILAPSQLQAVPLLAADQVDALTLPLNTLTVRTPRADVENARAFALLRWAHAENALHWRLSRGVLFLVGVLIATSASIASWRTRGLVLTGVGLVAVLLTAAGLWTSPILLLAPLGSWAAGDLGYTVGILVWAELKLASTPRGAGVSAPTPLPVAHR